MHGDNTFTSWDTSDDTSAAATESLGGGGGGSAFSSSGGGGGGGGGTGSGTGTEDVGALEEAIQQLSNTNAAVMSQNVTLTQELEVCTCSSLCCGGNDSFCQYTMFSRV